MDLDRLVNSVPEQQHRDDLARRVNSWKKDETDTSTLHQLIVNWYETVQFQDQESHIAFFKRLEKFKSEAIDGLNGFTGNERLFFFGLFDEWDHANSHERERIKRKIKI